MKNRLVILWSCCAVLLVIALFVVRKYITWQNDHFSCESHLTIVDHASTYDVIMHFAFNGGEGKYESTGRYLQNGIPPVVMTNNFNFKYWRENGRVVMVSVDNNVSPKNINYFLPNLPDFFRFKDRGMSVRIVPENAMSYTFIYEDAPLFYCTRNR
jgi:hypothetical protein